MKRPGNTRFDAAWRERYRVGGCGHPFVARSCTQYERTYRKSLLAAGNGDHGEYIGDAASL